MIEKMAQFNLYQRILFSAMLCVAAVAAVFASSGDIIASEGMAQEESVLDRPLEEIVSQLAPQNQLTLFPCSDCHNDLPPNPKKRELGEPHDELPGRFKHDPDNRWCLDCHDMRNRDKLKLLNGSLVDFKEYYRLCEQCHGRIYREWKVGVHNKITGHWKGEKQYWHCAKCHNPHDPVFKPQKPAPPPRKPAEVYIKTKK